VVNAVRALSAGSTHTLAAASVPALAAGAGLHLGKVAAEARCWHAIVSHAHPTGGSGFVPRSALSRVRSA